MYAFIALLLLSSVLFSDSLTIPHGVVAGRRDEDDWQVTLTTIGFMETMIGSEEAGRYCGFI
jgi:hypothetical protein